MEKEMVKFILAMIAKAQMPADDQTQANIAACKAWLNAIVAGNLVVKPAKQPKVKV